MLAFPGLLFLISSFHGYIIGNVEVTFGGVMFSGLVPRSLGVSTELPGESWESLKIGLSLKIGKLLGASSKSSLSNTDGSVMSQRSSTLKI